MCDGFWFTDLVLVQRDGSVGGFHGCGYTGFWFGVILSFFFFYSSCRGLCLPRWCCDLWWVVVATMVVMASGAVVGVVEEGVGWLLCV